MAKRRHPAKVRHARRARAKLRRRWCRSIYSVLTITPEMLEASQDTPGSFLDFAKEYVAVVDRQILAKLAHPDPRAKAGA